MFVPVLLAALISTLPADAGTSTTPIASSLKISIGAMTLSGDSITLTSGPTRLDGNGIGTFKCTIDGAAKLTLGSDGDTDFLITARKIVIVSDGKSPTSITCTGTCKCIDSEYRCSADNLSATFAKQGNMTLSGNAVVQYDSGAHESILAAETITCANGKFKLSGGGSLQRGK